MKVLLLFALVALSHAQEDPCTACPFPEIWNHTEKAQEDGNLVMIRHTEVGGCYLSIAGCQSVDHLLTDNTCFQLVPLFPYRCVNGMFEYSSVTWTFQTKKVRCHD